MQCRSYERKLFYFFKERLRAKKNDVKPQYVKREEKEVRERYRERK